MTIETIIARGLQILLALGGAYLIALWFALIVWTFRDIEQRSRSVVTQVVSTLMTALFFIPGVLLYRLLRPKETLDEAYQRSLEEEYLLQDLEELPLCPSCNHYVHDDFQVCPHCATQLREACSSCERLIDLRWDVCPYCGTTHQGHKHEEPKKVALNDERWIDPAAIERRLRAEEERRIREETRALPAATVATALGQERIDALSEYQRQESLNGNGRQESLVTVPRPEPQERTEPKQAVPDSDEPIAMTLPDLSGLEGPDDPEDDDEASKQTIPDQFRVKS